jgi:hypothetical protein
MKTQSPLQMLGLLIFSLRKLKKSETGLNPKQAILIIQLSFVFTKVSQGFIYLYAWILDSSAINFGDPFYSLRIAKSIL